MDLVRRGWGKEAWKIWSELAKSSASAAGEFATEASAVVALLQRLAIMLHWENAWAALRRFGHGVRRCLPDRTFLCLPLLPRVTSLGFIWLGAWFRAPSVRFSALCHLVRASPLGLLRVIFESISASRSHHWQDVSHMMSWS